jgi:hypothetical protein
MHLLKIYINPVKNGRNVDLCKIVAIEGEIVSVHEHLNSRFIHIAM